jgi:DNA-binding YbaB/EbfC family protein
MPNFDKLMKQAARMQQQVQEIQAGLAQRTVDAASGGGAVKVTAKCDGTLASIKIDPKAVDPSDVTMLEDLVLSAVNQALTQARDVANNEMGKVTAGLNMPGLM